MQTQNTWLSSFGGKAQVINNPNARVFVKPMTVSEGNRKYLRPRPEHRDRIFTAIAVEIYKQQTKAVEIYQALIEQKILTHKGSDPMKLNSIYAYIKKVRKMIGWKRQGSLHQKIIKMVNNGASIRDIASALNTTPRYVSDAKRREKHRIRKRAANERQQTTI